VVYIENKIPVKEPLSKYWVARFDDLAQLTEATPIPQKIGKISVRPPADPRLHRILSFLVKLDGELSEQAVQLLRPPKSSDEKK